MRTWSDASAGSTKPMRQDNGIRTCLNMVTSPSAGLLRFGGGRKVLHAWCADMYNHCPKCAAASAGQATCPKCGLIFAKYLKTAVGGAPVRTAPPVAEPEEKFRLSEWLFYVPDDVNPTTIYLRAALL